MILLITDRDGGRETLSGVTHIVQPLPQAHHTVHPNRIEFYRGKGSLENAEYLGNVRTNDATIEILPEA